MITPKTVYYVSSDYRAYDTKEEAERIEVEREKTRAYWATNSVAAKLDKLVSDLNAAQHVHPMTIATCTFDTIKLKAMCRVCNDFYESNKECLKYY